MRFARRLDITFPTLENKERNSLPSYGRLKLSKATRITRWSLDEIDSFIKPFEHLRPILNSYSVTDIKLLTPHIHTDDRSMINFYLDAGEEVTSFWDGDLKQDDRFTSDNGNTYLNVFADDLRVVERFTAKAGEVWVLNVEQAHSVLPNIEAEQLMIQDKVYDRSLIRYNRRCSRRAIQLGFKLSFDDLLERIYAQLQTA